MARLRRYYGRVDTLTKDENCWDCIGLFEDYYPTNHPKTFLYGCFMIIGDDSNAITTEELYKKCPHNKKKLMDEKFCEKMAQN